MTKKIEVNYINPDFLTEAIWNGVQKGANGLLKDMHTNDKIPKDTGLYQGSFSTKKDKKNSKVIVYENPKHSQGGRTKNRVIGHLLEHGVKSKNMPAQPHWGYFDEKHKPLIKEAITTEINKELT